jgi:hypothetical protein
MPAKINMFITNGNMIPPPMNLPHTQVMKPKTTSAPLNSGMISRINNVRPGCGSCGRKG